MTSTPKDDRETLALIEASLIADVLDDEMYPIEQVDADLRAAGLDPEQVRKRGADLASQLLKKRRLAWQDQARKTLERQTASASMPSDHMIIMGIDPGLATCGIVKLVVTGREVKLAGAALVKTSKARTRGVLARHDEERRLGEIVDGLESVRDNERIDVVAYETYRPFQHGHDDDGHDKHTAAHGRLVSMAVGAVMAWGQLVGVKNWPLDPSAPKRCLKAPGKAAVANIVEARIDGLTEWLDEHGRGGFHVTDAAGLALTAMVQIFKQKARAR